MPALLHTDRPWRLIPPMTASGQLQMQIDGWLLKQHEQGRHPPALRFYQWSRPAISLGYLQKDFPDRWRSLSQANAFDIVRRPTGGRAVLHKGDLTYAIVARYRQGRRREIYRHLCEFLIRGWRSLGLGLYYGDPEGRSGRSYGHRASCFGTATQADLIDAQGHKFIGSAQRYGQRPQNPREQGSSGQKLGGDRFVLQHGSMQLAPDTRLFEALFAEPAPKAQFSQVDDAFRGKVVETLTAAAQLWFDVEFVVQPLSAQELTEIRASPVYELSAQ